MDFKQLFNMIQELMCKKFYGTLEIEFKNGRPYLGVQSETILFDRPMSEKFSAGSSPSEINTKNIRAIK